MKSQLLALTIVLVGAGCGTPKVWYQPGTSAADTQRDFGYCQMQAANAPVNTGRNMNGIGVFMSASIADGNFLNACMLSKGYQPVPAKTVTNASSFPAK